MVGNSRLNAPPWVGLPPPAPSTKLCAPKSNAECLTQLPRTGMPNTGMENKILWGYQALGSELAGSCPDACLADLRTLGSGIRLKNFRHSAGFPARLPGTVNRSDQRLAATATVFLIRQCTDIPLVICMVFCLSHGSLWPFHISEAVVMQRGVREFSKRATADVRLLTDCAADMRNCNSCHCRPVIVKDVLLHLAVSAASDTHSSVQSSRCGILCRIAWPRIAAEVCSISGLRATPQHCKAANVIMVLPRHRSGRYLENSSRAVENMVSKSRLQLTVLQRAQLQPQSFCHTAGQQFVSPRICRCEFEECAARCLIQYARCHQQEVRSTALVQRGSRTPCLY